jgi:DNA-binding NarL/FixJ family response regulator
MTHEEPVINIFLVDDHCLFRNGLKNLLESFGHYAIIGEASNGVEFLDFLDYITPDIVLLDISMPVMDGPTTLSLALKKNPDLKVIALSMYGEEEYYFKMSNAGAKGFLLKNSSIDEVQTAIETVYNGSFYFSQELLINIVTSMRQHHFESVTIELSRREEEILTLICQGKSNNEIANILFISKRTVEKHRANLLGKAMCNNTASLVVWAIRNKIIKI